MTALEATLRTIGERIPPECLVLVETTVAPGTTEFVAFPILKKAFQKRGIQSAPLLAHSFERVMPGRQYVASIRDFWRVCSGCTPEARERVVKFLKEVLNVAFSLSRASGDRLERRVGGSFSDADDGPFRTASQDRDATGSRSGGRT